MCFLVVVVKAGHRCRSKVHTIDYSNRDIDFSLWVDQQAGKKVRYGVMVVIVLVVVDVLHVLILLLQTVVVVVVVVTHYHYQSHCFQ